MSLPRRLLPLPIVALALAGCSLGDGPRVSETRAVASFTRLDNRASVDVRVHVGEPQRVKVRAGENVIDDVDATVSDGTLVLSFDHHGFGGNDVVVEAWVPKLTAVTTSGSGDIAVDGIDADAFEVRSDGSSDVALAGTTDRLAVLLDGSGDAELGDLMSREAHVAVHGSGDADVRAGERLDVELDGSGDVRYHGSPALTRRVDGSGDLSRAD